MSSIPYLKYINRSFSQVCSFCVVRSPFNICKGLGITVCVFDSHREGTRLLGAPRSGHMRTGSKEMLTPINNIKHHNHHPTKLDRSGEHNTLRSHSTSEIGDGSSAVLKKSRGEFCHCVDYLFRYWNCFV